MQMRKVASAALGAFMAGATLAAPVFAADYTLDDFPAPFVVGGETDFVIVVGADALSSDSAGAADVVAGIVSGTSDEDDTVTVTGETWRVEEPGDDLNYNESFSGIDQSLDETDLPS